MYRTRERVPERGGKPGFYVIVSRTFIASSINPFDHSAAIQAAPSAPSPPAPDQTQ